MRARADIAAALVLSALTALFALSAVRPGAMLGNWQHPDTLANHWVMRWVAEQALTGGDLRHNDRYYWPIGDDPLTNGNAMEGFTYLPFAAILPWPDALSAWALCALTLNGIAAYTLARAIGAGAVGGWLASVAVVSHPYLAGELSAGHFPQAELAWLLFALAALAHLLDTRRWVWVLPTVLLASICGVLYWYHAVFLGIAASLLALERLVRDRGRLPWLQLTTGLLASLVLVGPWLRASLDAQVPGLGEAFPHPEAISAALRWGLPFGVEGPYQQGRVAALALLPLALLGLRGGWGWLAIGAAAWALGTAGWCYEALYGLAEPLRRFWWPYRHGALLLVAWAMLAARGAGRLPGWAGLALALTIPLQLHLTGDLSRVKASPMTPLRPPIDGGVVLEPPLFPGAALSQAILASQMAHGQPTVTGHALWVDRVRPDAWDRFVAGSALLGSLQRWERGGRLPIDTDDLDALRARGLRWLLVNPGNFARELGDQADGYRALGRALGGEPVWAERGVELYALRESPGPIALPPVRWPAGLRPGGPTKPLAATAMPNPVFGEVVGGRTR